MASDEQPNRVIIVVHDDGIARVYATRPNDLCVELLDTSCENGAVVSAITDLGDLHDYEAEMGAVAGSATQRPES
jgi:hypothetical protein